MRIYRIRFIVEPKYSFWKEPINFLRGLFHKEISTTFFGDNSREAYENIIGIAKKNHPKAEYVHVSIIEFHEEEREN